MPATREEKLFQSLFTERRDFYSSGVLKGRLKKHIRKVEGKGREYILEYFSASEIFKKREEKEKIDSTKFSKVAHCSCDNQGCYFNTYRGRSGEE